MSKIYIFAIGGTGSRVLRSLTMLLASGVECQADAIVPIIIDPDVSLEDRTRTVNLMYKYSSIRKHLNFTSQTSNNFFRTNIEEKIHGYSFMLNNTNDQLFRRYIDYESMSVKNKALTKALFSEKELNMDMERGFKGHPNIGSVVMNQLGRSEEFLDIANEFGPEDKIFIISSIFGGTGASGFPVLLKTLRTSDRIPNRGLVNNAPIGAVTVLPYFQVKHDDSSEIDSSTFTSKTKAALSYYHRTLRGMTTTLYYVGDNNPSTYDNHEGSVEQRNNAHFVELMSALAILDFCRETSHDHPLFKEYGIKNKTKEICFNDLGPRSRRLLIGNLTQFMLFTRYFKECTLLRAQAWAKDRRLDSSFFDSNDMVTLRSVQSDFASWLKELSQQERKFMPFDLECPPEKLFSLVTDCEPKWSLKKNYNLFNDRLNSVPTTGGDQMQQLIELFHTATQKLVKEKFNIE